MKFISPGGWFSMELPSNWSEFEDTTESFLFYNPEKWSGNFRISAYRDKSKDYAKECIKDELENNDAASLVKVGDWDCAYSCETFQEEHNWYTTHIWITGKEYTSFECSFTIAKGGDIKAAQDIIKSISVREPGKKYPREIIPVRLMEIEEINSGFEWAVSTIKKQLSKDFTSEAKDIKSIQSIIDSGKINASQRNAWENLGIAFGAILINEMDGMEWVSIIDDNNEYPALRFKDSDLIVDAIQIIWKYINKGEKCNLQSEFDKIALQATEILEK